MVSCCDFGACQTEIGSIAWTDSASDSNQASHFATIAGEFATGANFEAKVVACEKFRSS